MINRRKRDGPGAISHLMQAVGRMTAAPVRALEIHSYYKPFLRTGDRDLERRIWSFHEDTQEKPSTVWVIDCYAQLGELKASGPFNSERDLFNYILSTERKIKTSRIFVVEGTASWSTGVIGSECKVPVDFFLDSTDEHVQLKSGEGLENYTITMDNACIAPHHDGERKFLNFEALGSHEIQPTRSHIFFNERHHTMKTAVVLCQSRTTGLGSSLVSMLVGDKTKCQRLCDDIHWIVWDTWHELNNWPLILEKCKLQLQIEEENAKHPELELTKALHRDTSTHIELQEMLRVQIAILDRFVKSRESPDSCKAKSKCISRLGDLKSRLRRHQAVLDILTKQTSNLISEVYNTMAIEESTSIGKLTWITLIYLPLGFASSLFSMNIEAFNTAAKTWVYAVCALLFLLATIVGAIGATSLVRRRWKILRKLREYLIQEESELQDVKIEGLIPESQLNSAASPNPDTYGVVFASKNTLNTGEWAAKITDLRAKLRIPLTHQPLDPQNMDGKPGLDECRFTEADWRRVKGMDLALTERQKRAFGVRSQFLQWTGLDGLQHYTSPENIAKFMDEITTRQRRRQLERQQARHKFVEGNRRKEREKDIQYVRRKFGLEGDENTTIDGRSPIDDSGDFDQFGTFQETYEISVPRLILIPPDEESKNDQPETLPQILVDGVVGGVRSGKLRSKEKPAGVSRLDEPVDRIELENSVPTKVPLVKSQKPKETESGAFYEAGTAKAGRLRRQGIEPTKSSPDKPKTSPPGRSSPAVDEQSNSQHNRSAIDDSGIEITGTNVNVPIITITDSDQEPGLSNMDHDVGGDPFKSESDLKSEPGGPPSDTAKADDDYPPSNLRPGVVQLHISGAESEKRFMIPVDFIDTWEKLEMVLRTNIAKRFPHVDFKRALDSGRLEIVISGIIILPEYWEPSFAAAIQIPDPGGLPEVRIEFENSPSILQSLPNTADGAKPTGHPKPTSLAAPDQRRPTPKVRSLPDIHLHRTKLANPGIESSKTNKTAQKPRPRSLERVPEPVQPPPLPISRSSSKANWPTNQGPNASLFGFKPISRVPTLNESMVTAGVASRRVSGAAAALYPPEVRRSPEDYPRWS